MTGKRADTMTGKPSERRCDRFPWPRRRLLAVTALGVAVVQLSTAPAGAIVVRHDRDPARYLELGAAFDSVCKVGERMGDGTVIGATRILTAAHVARGLAARGGEVECGGRRYAVTATFIHPDWTDMGPHDVAVLHLARPVEGIEPVPLYSGTDEIGQIATLVGHGATGSGDSRERTDDGLRRAATNRVAEANDRHLVFVFDAPPDGTDLEGIPGPGDSGGPALVDVDGVMTVAGVSSAGEPGENGPGTYGARDYFVRVSTHRDWIEEAVAGRTERYEPGEPTLPDGVAGQRLQAVLDLIAAGASADIDAFLDQHMVPDPDRRAARRSNLRALIDEYAGATVTQVMPRGSWQVDVVVTTTAGRKLLGVRVAEETPHRINGLFTGRP